MEYKKELFEAEISDDPDQLWELGVLLEELHNSFLRQYVRFAQKSPQGKKCIYARAAFKCYLKDEHTNFVMKLRRVLERK